MKIENRKRCDNCFFSLWIMGPNRPALTCKQRVRFVGTQRIVLLDWSCANFYPSGDFRLSRQSSNEDGKAGDQAVRRIPLTRGKFALVDAKDYYRLIKFNWFTEICARTSYAARTKHRSTIMMHRVIMKAPDHLVVDHIDHNGLNNCRSNLRLCTSAQNSQNMASIARGRSKYKGIYWDKQHKKWVAKIQVNGKRTHIGIFKNEIDAAKAYDEKASQLHGEFACLNFPSEAQSRTK